MRGTAGGLGHGHRGFPGVAFGGARADARAAARGARGAVGPERRRGIEGSNRAWCGRGPALSALLERGGGFARYGRGVCGRYQCKGCGRTFNALSGTPLSGLPSTRWSRRTPRWSPTVARATPLAPPRSGRATKHSTARWGNGFGRSACADGEQPPQPVEGLPASSPWHRHPLSRQLPELVPPRWPRPRRQRPGLPRRRHNKVTHTIQ